ncbi:hypothetical protein MFLAVUS_006395 [Mucor flavus]|uniref:Uncharacterized protein n=1 Tax=Mucor flavus TaxID=439312 RepID=A0ABP9Z1E6_9FUNG
MLNTTLKVSLPSSPLDSEEQVTFIKPKTSNPNEEKYLSWFPHSDFPEQQEAFRNGLRLALETKRTIIAPMLRINKIYPWMPFEDLAKRYEAQDKVQLAKACAAKIKNWQTELEPCETLHDWFEVPWSSIMDLESIKKDYGIRIIERTSGHGWGVHESALGGNVDPSDVAIVDVMTYKENGTNWERIDTEKPTVKQNSFSNWIQSNFLAKEEKLTEPLKYVLTEDKLMEIDAKIIQFGALSSAARYATTTSEIQLDLRKAMMKTRFNVPDQLTQLTKQSNAIVSALGGKFQYSTLILNLSKLVALDARAGNMQNLAVDGGNTSPVKPSTHVVSMEDLNDNSKKELMDAVVLEIFGDIPINQAISAAMPIKPSKLADLLETGRSLTNPLERKQLLEACVEYHKKIETKYPVYYLMNDMDIAAETRPDIFGPLIKMFPCVFSTADMKKWDIQSENWAQGQEELNDPNVNYEKLLQPLLDILIAGKGYSFFEIPTTPLTRFLNWSPKV